MATNPKINPGRRCAPRSSYGGGTPGSATYPRVGPLRESPSGCVASEGGAPFVARRAMNLHGCASASKSPFPQIPAFESSCAASEGDSVRGSPCGEPARLRFTSLCPPFFLLRGYPGSAKLVLGRPPSCGDSAEPSHYDVRQKDPFSFVYARRPPARMMSICRPVREWVTSKSNPFVTLRALSFAPFRIASRTFGISTWSPWAILS